MSETHRPLTLRMPADLLAQLRASARKHDRSAGGEVRHIVREHLAQKSASEKATP